MRKIQSTRQEVREIHSYIMLCDICGKKSYFEKHWGWDYDKEDRITVHREYGTYYPDGGFGKKISLDICPECFDEMLEFLKKKSVSKLEYEEWDY